MTIHKQLHDATDILNDALVAFEDELREHRFGVPACVQIDAEHTLRYEKHGGTFRLCVGGTALTSCSRTLRLAAVRVLDKLYIELEVLTRSEWERVKEATSVVDALTSRIRNERRAGKGNDDHSGQA